MVTATLLPVAVSQLGNLVMSRRGLLGGQRRLAHRFDARGLLGSLFRCGLGRIRRLGRGLLRGGGASFLRSQRNTP